MMKQLLCLMLPLYAFGQGPNCNVYLYNKDTAQYKACKSVENVRFYQYTRQYQEQYDKALDICPYFSHAWRAKSTAYLKSGDFLTWKYLIDKAVQYDTMANIGYRGWCRFQFFRDYQGAIADIEYVERRNGILNAGYAAGGEYHLTAAKAICYSALGDKRKAVQTLENLLAVSGYSPGFYDYYQLAVTYFQLNDYANALKYLNRQSEVYELAENKYYKAKLAKMKGDKQLYEKEKQEAVRLYRERKMLFDPYTEPFNKIYLSTILNE